MHISKHTIQKGILYLVPFSLTLFLFFYTTDAHAATQNFSPLVGLPGITDLKTATLPEYINAIYLVLIGLGTLIGVIRISWAGVKYSLSAGSHHLLETAKSDIKGVLLGLAILLIPYIVLNTINPELTNLNVLQLAPKVNLTETPRNLTATQTTAMNECTARPEMKWDVATGLCVPYITTASDNLRELQRFCEMTAGYKWDATKTPPSCVPPPSGAKVVPDDTAPGSVDSGYADCIATGGQPGDCSGT